MLCIFVNSIELFFFNLREKKLEETVLSEGGVRLAVFLV